MAKSRKLEAILTELTQLRNDPTSAQSIDKLRQALGSKHSIAVAKAAKIAGEFELNQLTSDLVSAFNRFMTDPVETDQGCLAKTGIAEALYRIGCEDATVFLLGIRYRQMESVWGGKEDSAAGIRSSCAMGLVRMNYSEVLTELADLLADPIPTARTAAARAIAYSDNPQGVPLLRLRALVGDEPQVIYECLAGLLKLAPAGSLHFVASFLDAQKEQTRELTALALGESRLSEAFDILQSWWSRTVDAELRCAGLLAIGMLRHDRPIAFLLSLIADGTVKDARDAIAALSLYRDDKALWQRVQHAAEKRGSELHKFCSEISPTTT